MPGSSTSLMSSLRRIETPDDETIRFVLSRVDTQFGWALASPTASIVDEESYDADQIQPVKGPIVGSGPFQVVKFADDELQLSRYPDYIGRNPGRIPELVYRTAPDSATIEDAMTKGAVDVVWRGLDAAAVTRLSQQAQQSPEEQTASGFNRDGAHRHPGPAAAVVARPPRCGRIAACGRRSPPPCRATAPPIRSCPAGCPGTCRPSRSAAR